MALTYTDNGGGAPDGSDLTFTYSFETIKTTTGGANAEVKVSLDGETQATTKYTVNSSPASITFNNTSIDSTKQESTGAPKSGVKVRVYRDTAVATPGDKRHTFQAGSAIKANALNDVYEHGLCMPSYPELKKEQIIYVCDKIKEALSFNETELYCLNNNIDPYLQTK